MEGNLQNLKKLLKDRTNGVIIKMWGAWIETTDGQLTQLAECYRHMVEVEGSSPPLPTSTAACQGQNGRLLLFI